MLQARLIEDERIECGCDEAGRGCLAGPVFAAAVVLPEGFEHPWLNDSKQLSEHRRRELRPIIEAEALAWAVGVCTAEEIDRINILKASHLAMRRAVEALSLRPERLLIDGNRFTPIEGLEHHCIVKGDAKFRAIAAASILAKTHRDEYMQTMAVRYPLYGWERNKGYPTPEHKVALRIHGASPEHRITFADVSHSIHSLFP
ncbi:ribonuclease HII [Porphyromonas sp. COT-239 OH1446]|uniref:ribonuclease HII n=1 Tax=Porphyromonas sp. COT-239 OH1446 TaxID=1515613 RepID=UPI00052BDBC8|nr:ribonuclease HII [Porphyromonas sp. COT-239 OH1446]KGN68338.1 ribonuclease HII [Porphyromonas sp. COT-239 OH1446]